MDRITRLPIKYSLIFLVLTEVLVWIGPIDYTIKKPLVLILYLGILNYALYLGYRRGVRKSKVTSCKLSIQTIHFFLILGLICTIYTMYVKWGARGYSLTFRHLIDSIINPGQAYVRDEKVVFNVSILYVLISPFQWAAIPFGVYYWKRLDSFFKFIVIATFIFTIATWLGIGTRKGLLDLLIITAVLLLAKNPSILNNKHSVRKIKIIGMLLVVVFLFYFVISNLSRGGLLMSEISQYERVEYKEWYAKNIPTPIVVGLSEITSYLSGGYQLLSLGLDEGIITPTFMGMSLSTANYANRFLGYDPLPGTYMQLIQDKYGYDKYEYWHTMYLWLANDFSFILVPLIIFIIGFYFARVWVDTVNGKNAFAYPVFAYILVMVFYLFANNQVISFNLESFIGCVLLYEFSKSNSRSKSFV